MSRRALRPIDANLDLSRHYLAWEQVPPNCTSRELFGREAPLEIEVGSGKGLFLSSVAAHHPEANYLGIEVVLKYARFAAARLARAQVNNAKLINGDALRIFSERLPNASVRAVHVYFPDPWWKARHRKRRVINEQFLKDVERTLAPGGSLHFWSDVAEYFQTTLDLLAACSRLVGPLGVPERPAEHELDYRTHFERRMRLHNQVVYRAEFRKAELT